MTDYREQLRGIRTFPMLVRFLRDELQWPIDSAAADFEDLTFDYTPEELGIDAASTANIEEIKQLRRLSPNQPWGVFFIKFEPKRLPVIALRRILGRLVIKKRMTAGAGERPRWSADDLLFISNYGAGSERKISFAHFSQNPKKTDLPTLKVLAWDDLDTPLHLEHAANTLVEKLAWPRSEEESDKTKWRQRWRSAFELEHREVVTTSRALAVHLAALAGRIRARIREVLEIETDNGPMKGLMEAFREALVHDLDADSFADMYAQTIAYGLLSARIADPTADRASDLATHIRTSPFLRELMENFIHVGASDSHLRPAVDFDELGVSDVIALLDRANFDAILRDFGDRNPLDDPVIFFYELFLKEYDAKKRMQRGVFYTPRPVVSYIVRSVHELLQTEFGLADGLADTATWGEMVERHDGLVLPDGMDPANDFVAILDPATGTGTFLVEAIDVIHRTVTDKWKRGGCSPEEALVMWNAYVPEHLLPRLHGYELLMAPYAIAHMKVGLKLYETGYRFDSDERARIYLTNSLEPPEDFGDRLAFAIPALAHEAQAVNTIKRDQRFTVIVGNPPYASVSSNMTRWIRDQANTYLTIGGQRIEEKSKRNPLQNDYVKFIRLAHYLADAAGVAAIGLITSASYLDGRTLRGLRWHLLQSFPTIDLFDLHGDSKKRDTGRDDENVFDITEGVTIGLFSRGPLAKHSTVSYRHEVGSREHKYQTLGEGGELPANITLNPRAPLFVFRPQDEDHMAEFQDLGPRMDQLFELSGAGVITNRDDFATADASDVLLSRMKDFRNPSLSDASVRAKYDLHDNSVWKLDKARVQFRRTEIDPSKIVPLTYRPFDVRLMYYDKVIVFNPRFATMTQLLTRDNLAIVTTGQVDSPDFCHVFISRGPVEKKLATHYGASIVFPLFRREDGGLLSKAPLVANLAADARNLLAVAERVTRDQTQAVFAVGFYMYGVLHSPTYRARFAPQLRVGFPRIPCPLSADLLSRVAGLGSELVALHLLESPQLDQPITTYTGPALPQVRRVGWSDDTVWLDAPATKRRAGAAQGTAGFQGVPEAIWNFHIGGYRVCEKWLKDRSGRTLSQDDIAHYQKIVVALGETIRIMAQIDEAIDAHGGWPTAFVSPVNSV